MQQHYQHRIFCDFFNGVASDLDLCMAIAAINFLVFRALPFTISATNFVPYVGTNSYLLNI